jgi:hypothetical protein
MFLVKQCVQNLYRVQEHLRYTPSGFFFSKRAWSASARGLSAASPAGKTFRSHVSMNRGTRPSSWIKNGGTPYDDSLAI